MTDLLLRMLLGATLGLALVLLLRRPARRVFGAESAFVLWLLPVVLALTLLLPRGLAPTVVMLPGLIVVPNTHAVVSHAGVGINWALTLGIVWLAGATLGIVRLAWHYRHLCSGARSGSTAWLAAMQQSTHGLDVRRVRMHVAGPAVLWALPRTLVLLPDDFAQRFGNAATRELVLRHELAHVRRGDAWWSLGMEVTSALLWFHPLAWLARSRFRLDQELACDAASLRALPGRATHYAHALLDSVAVQPAPALIPWLAEPQLKERIAMLARIPPGALRRRAGFFVIALLLAGGFLLAGGQTAVAVQTATNGTPGSASPSIDIGYKNRNPPKYPVNSLRNGEQGTIQLKVHVDASGDATKVEVESSRTTASSAELQAAAVTAAESWKFTPGEKDGKPVGGWITIPVIFSLFPMESCPSGQVHAEKPRYSCEPASSSVRPL